MPEIWKDIKGYKGFYQVSDYGRVRSLDRKITQRDRWGNTIKKDVKGVVLSQMITHKGYATVVLIKDGKRDRREVHRLVADAFLGPLPRNCQTHHKNSDRTDSRLSNLEYMPIAEHLSNHHRGTANYRTNLSENDVREIRNLLSTSDRTISDVAKQFGISTSAAKHIKQGRSWKHIK